MSTTLKVIGWICRLIVAGIFLQTLFFKFNGAEESKYIFTKLVGAEYEAFARIATGIAELITAILILFPKTVAIGAFVSVGVIFGAIMSHITQLGIVVQNDGGELFSLAITILVLSLASMFIYRKELPIIGDKF